MPPLHPGLRPFRSHLGYRPDYAQAKALAADWQAFGSGGRFGAIRESHPRPPHASRVASLRVAPGRAARATNRTWHLAPSAPAQAAHQVYLEIIGEAPPLIPQVPDDSPPPLRNGRVPREGEGRIKKLTPERHREIAKDAARAQWDSNPRAADLLVEPFRCEGDSLLVARVSLPAPTPILGVCQNRTANRYGIFVPTAAYLHAALR